MPDVEILRIRRNARMRNVVLVIGSNEHERDVCNILAAFQAGDVLEYVVPIVWLALIGSFEELELDRASHRCPCVRCELKPDVDAAALALRTAQRLLEL